MSLIRRYPEKDAVQRRERDPFALMQETLRWDPLRELWPPKDGEFAPSFEVKETKNAYLFKADMPGVKEGDLDVSLSGNRLTISGRREEERRDEGDRYYTYERSYGSFSRSFTLPEGTNADNIEAELKDGVLTLTVPKKPDVQPKRIWFKRRKNDENKSAAD
jgi:HSP20 family protein